MTPTDASERERQRAWLKSQPLHLIAHNILETMDADAEKIRTLEAGRIEAQHVAQHLSLWRGRAATSRTWDRGEEVDLLGALLDKLDAAIAATQSPRSEAGEGA